LPFNGCILPWRQPCGSLSGADTAIGEGSAKPVRSLNGAA
jgi:hypothetical protein